MKANELRIGNLVELNNPNYRPKDTGKTFHIWKIDSMDDSCNGVCAEDMPYAEVFGQFLKHIKPIPLTEEWLVKFGFFEKYKSTSNRWNIGGFELHDCEDDDEKLQGVFLYDFKLEVKYVHQLQNLYFALTGVELELSSNN
jgi:hypothetical protein